MNNITRRTASVLAAAAMTASFTVPAAALARNEAAPRATFAAIAAAPVTPVAADSQLAKDLSYLREEEKLAHDVYTALYEKWNLRVFTNIAASEQRHTDSVAVLLDRYGINDPADGRATGEFSDPQLQKLYGDLVARGSVSLTEALSVGKAIEELDIADLDEFIAHTTQPDVVTVLKNLRAGSVNHLRAFTAQLSGSTAGAARSRRGR